MIVDYLKCLPLQKTVFMLIGTDPLPLCGLFLSCLQGLSTTTTVQASLQYSTYRHGVSQQYRLPTGWDNRTAGTPWVPDHGVNLLCPLIDLSGGGSLRVFSQPSGSVETSVYGLGHFLVQVSLYVIKTWYGNLRIKVIYAQDLRTKGNPTPTTLNEPLYDSRSVIGMTLAKQSCTIM